VADLQHQATRVREVGEFLCVRGVLGDRFLYQHVLAALKENLPISKCVEVGVAMVAASTRDANSSSEPAAFVPSREAISWAVAACCRRSR
jgi:hypothetical protein